jgi:hypothetical protein
LSEVADFGGEDFESTKKMRLEPIEKPKSIFLKLAYWFSCRQFGVVLTPMKVIYARKPPLLSLAMKMSKFEEKQTSLPEDLRLFIETEIVEILALTAIEHFYNALTIPLEIESDGLRQIAEQRKAN